MGKHNQHQQAKETQTCTHNNARGTEPGICVDNIIMVENHTLFALKQTGTRCKGTVDNNWNDVDDDRERLF